MCLTTFIVFRWKALLRRQSPPEAESRCEIIVQFFTFSRIKFRIQWIWDQGLQNIFCKHTIQNFRRFIGGLVS